MIVILNLGIVYYFLNSNLFNKDAKENYHPLIYL